MRTAGFVVASLILLACETKPTPTAESPAMTTATTTASAPPPASSGARNIPPPDVACTKDDDCVTFDDDITGATTCCPGCTWHAASKDGLKKFQAACHASPAPMCPPLGCTMANMVAKCTAGACTTVLATAANPTAGGACDFWGGRGFHLHLQNQSGRGDFFRRFDYDDKTRVLAIDDSEVYADGKTELKTPRVTKKSKTLTQAEADALVSDLNAWCPTPEERKRECAPGGCSQIDVKTAAGTTGRAGFVDKGVVTKTYKRLSAFFPEVRQPQ
jgi:hypothetical protein